MPFLNLRCLQQVRSKFVIPNMDNLRWYPGHMEKGIRKMQQKLRSVDCIIEVHDARIPLSGRNPNFKHFITGSTKPHILVLNKMDLTDGKYNDRVQDYIIKKQGISHVVYTNCKDENSVGLDKLVPLVREMIKGSNRYNRNDELEYCVMIIGVPNVGKSSLINALRAKYLKKGKVAMVGAIAGITKTVQNRIKVSNQPHIYVYDTPGILTPSVPDIETGMKLALCSTLHDRIVGEITMADYLLYWLNRQQNYSYFNYFAINEPSDDIKLLLAKKAIKEHWTFKMKNHEGNIVIKPSVQKAADMFVQAFRCGLLGSITLDSDVIPYSAI